MIVSAPSGSGKTTIVNALISRMPEVGRSISYTTRPRREGEVEGEDYYFVSQEEFEERKNNKDFLEWEENFGNYYGTSREQVDSVLGEGRDIILSIDVKGARSVKDIYQDAISVFIMPPSRQELAERLRKRNTDEAAQVLRRLQESKKEIDAADEYDYLIVNKDLTRAVEELAGIIENERRNREKIDKRTGQNGKDIQTSAY